MCGFCLPYLSKEETEKLINDVSRLLNPEGVFYISTGKMIMKNQV